MSTTDTENKLLEVPLGTVDSRATIVITVGLDKSHPSTTGVDADFTVGISDGTNNNQQYIVDVDNYGNNPSCYPDSASHDNNITPPGTPFPSTLKLTFIPFYKYGACETAQEGGFIETGTFNAQIDTSKPLSLSVFRHTAPEQVFLHYIRVEIY
jgi:hypothetical protein